MDFSDTTLKAKEGMPPHSFQTEVWTQVPHLVFADIQMVFSSLLQGMGVPASCGLHGHLGGSCLVTPKQW